MNHPLADTACACSTGSVKDPQNIATWLLRVAVLLHAVALFLIVFQNRQTQFGNLLFMNWFGEMEEPYLKAVFVEKITVSLYLASCVAIFFRPFWPLLLPVAAYAFLEAYAALVNTGSRYSDWSLVTQALRYGAPLVLLLLTAGPRVPFLRAWSPPIATSLLRVLIAMVFFSHGWLALLENPRFIDLIIGTSGNIFGSRLTEASAVIVLKWIAGIDFLVALAILVYPTFFLLPRKWWGARQDSSLALRMVLPALIIWLAGWGFITALSRITTLGIPAGLGQYPELLIRASHFLGPLALWALFAASLPRSITEQKNCDK